MSTLTAMSPAEAVVASRADDLDTRIHAREVAESLGYASFRTQVPLPPEFAGVPALSEGFDEGLLNARCEYEQLRAGLL